MNNSKLNKLTVILLLHLSFCFSASAQDFSPEDFDKLQQVNFHGAVAILELVKFSPGGESHFDVYDSSVEGLLTSARGELIYRGFPKPFEGPGALREAARIGSTPELLDWDRVTIRKYPSINHVIAAHQGADFREALSHWTQGVERSHVYAFAADGMQPVPLSNSTEPVYMLNLLRFNEDGGEEGYAHYGSFAGPMLQSYGGRGVVGMSALTSIQSSVELDRVILVYYPSSEVFLDFILSEEYEEIGHLRTESVEVGINLPFGDFE